MIFKNLSRQAFRTIECRSKPPFSSRDFSGSVAPRSVRLPSITSVAKDHLVLNFPSTTNLTPSTASAKFHYVWLRDNCQCRHCVHPDNRQKLHSSGDVNINLEPKSVKIDTTSPQSPKLVVEWPAGSLIRRTNSSFKESHTTVMDLKWLLESGHPRNPSLTPLRPPPKSTIHWDAQLYAANDNRVSYNDYMNTEEGLLKTLRQLHDYGLCFLSGVPTANDKEVENVARRIGEIKETFYGVSWDVKSVPKAKNIAYTSLDLGLHMDLLYFEAPPGIQMLHSLKNSVKGGQSTFLDSFQAVDILRETSPQDFEVLTKVPVTFHYRNDGHIMKYRRPTIVTNDANEPLKVYYAPPFQGPMDVEEEQTVPFYRAFQKFSDILRDPSLTYRTLLKSGDLVLFHNRRVLHGRDEFDAQSGERHYKGTYIDIDMFNDKLATLEEKEK
ncbi:hypothetical protein HDV05_007109 [Chytridiales sp. JEL 0842]|nr:hypothetical protein HDV05_007109 [Chytridiales sp. JEL 0842]